MSNTAQSTDRRVVQPQVKTGSSNPFKNASIGAQKQQAETKSAATPAAKLTAPSQLNGLSFGAQPRPTVTQTSRALSQTTKTSTVTTSNVRTPKIEKKVVARMQQAAPQTIFDRFINWLARTIKALIDKFLSRFQVFRFKITSLVAKLKKHGDSPAKEAAEKKENDQDDKLDGKKGDSAKAQDGPGVAMS